MTGRNATRAYIERLVKAGRCPRCGKPAAPYLECEEHRALARERSRLRREKRGLLRRPRKVSMAQRVERACVECGDKFSASVYGPHHHGRRCHPCKAEYQRALRLRHIAYGPPTAGPCRICGGRLNARNRSGEHLKCTWTKRFEERQRKWREEREELTNPTTEKSWLRVARLRLSEAQRLLRDASRSQTRASRPAETSR